MNFLKYVEGARPGKKPRKETAPSDIQASKRIYEKTKRHRSFQPQWKTHRPWLEFQSTLDNGEQPTMFCTWCRAVSFDNRNPFCIGTNNFKVDAIKQHEVSKCHLFCSSKFKHPVQKAAKCIQMLRKADYDNLAIKFRTAHFVAKHHKSFRDYDLICRLDKAKGLDVGTNYVNDKAAATMVNCIAEVSRKETFSHLDKVKYVSFTCDGSTDFTGDEMENIYIRSCLNGKIYDTFLNIGSPESGSSADIYKHIQNVFKDSGLESIIQQKLVGFCSDGAANMQGLTSGLAALLLEQWPHVVVIHCIAHRLELSKKPVPRCMTGP